MKRYRVYFNRASEWPTVWSVDEGSQSSEFNVSGVLILGCTVETRADINETVNRDRPKAWLEVCGHLSIEDGIAVIRGQKDGADSLPVARH